MDYNSNSALKNLEFPAKRLVAPSSPLEGLTLPKNKGDLYAILFYLLLDAMVIRQNTVLTQSKGITLNAAIQDKLNKAMGKISFVILKSGAKQATIDAVQEENEQLENHREDLQNDLITTRQNGQVIMTQTSTNVNILEQDASMNSGVLNILNTIFKVIDQISPNSQ